MTNAQEYKQLKPDPDANASTTDTSDTTNTAQTADTTDTELPTPKISATHMNTNNDTVYV